MRNKTLLSAVTLLLLIAMAVAACAPAAEPTEEPTAVPQEAAPTAAAEATEAPPAYTTEGKVMSVRLVPQDPPPCPQALQAVEHADHLVLGPGSWYTSVTAPLLVPSLRASILASSARRLLVLNLCPQPGETSGFAPHTHLEVWRRDFPEIALDSVLADPGSVTDVEALQQAAAALGAQVHLLPIAAGDARNGLHDPNLLAAAFAAVLGRGRISAWR
jgi:uncharacterized cofD-like protein